MLQQPAYSVGARYVRMRDTGSVFPVHAEQLKLVRKDLADLVEWNGTHFFKVDIGAPVKEAPVKIEAPKLEPVTPEPMTQRIFAPPPVIDPIKAQIDAMNASSAPVPPPAPVQPVTFAAPPPPATQAPPAVAPQAPPVVKTVIGQPQQRVDLSVEPPPE